jgi:peroxiredoxin
MTDLNLVRWAARELSRPNQPIKFLVELAHCPRATAKAWYCGHRRAPIWFLQRLHGQAQDRQLGDLAGQLDYHLQQREREPPRARGFMLRDPLTGLDKRNRRGRSRNSGDAETATICAFGWKARDFALTGVDRKTYSLADVRGPKGTLVVFICNHCPHVKASIDRIVLEANALREIGIGTIAIMPSDTTVYWEDSFGSMQLFAVTHAFSFPYVVDESQEVARAYGSGASTPDSLILTVPASTVSASTIRGTAVSSSRTSQVLHLIERPNCERIVAIAPGYANFRGSTVTGAILAPARSTAKMWADGLSVTVGLWPSGVIRPPMCRTRTMRGNIRSGCGPAHSLRPGTGVIVVRKQSYSAAGPS